MLAQLLLKLELILEKILNSFSGHLEKFSTENLLDNFLSPL